MDRRRFAIPEPRRIARYVAGIVVVSLAASIGIQSGTGAAPYDALLVTLSERFGTPFWLTAWILQGVWVLAIWRAGGRIRLGSLAHSLAFGPIMGAFLAIIPPASGWILSGLYLAGALVGIAVGLWLYLGAAFLSGMMDTLFETLAGRGDFRESGIRTVFDVGIVAYAWVGDGPVGVGTIVLAFGVGPILGAISDGVVHPASWRGIGLGPNRARTNTDTHDELVDTGEYTITSL